MLTNLTMCFCVVSIVEEVSITFQILPCNCLCAVDPRFTYTLNEKEPEMSFLIYRMEERQHSGILAGNAGVKGRQNFAVFGPGWDIFSFP